MLFQRFFSTQMMTGVPFFAEWTVSTRLTISSQAAAEKQLSGKTMIIGVYSDSDVVFRFDTATGDSNSANNDLIVQANSLTFLNVPAGLRGQDTDNDVFFHVKQVTSVASKFLRLVEL